MGACLMLSFDSSVGREDTYVPQTVWWACSLVVRAVVASSARAYVIGEFARPVR